MEAGAACREDLLFQIPSHRLCCEFVMGSPWREETSPVCNTHLLKDGEYLILLNAHLASIVLCDDISWHGESRLKYLLHRQPHNN